MAPEMPPHFSARSSFSVLSILSLRHVIPSPGIKLFSQKALKSPPQFPNPGADPFPPRISNSSSNSIDTLSKETGSWTPAADPGPPFSPVPASLAPQGIIMCSVRTIPTPGPAPPPFLAQQPPPHQALHRRASPQEAATVVSLKLSHTISHLSCRSQSGSSL